MNQLKIRNQGKLQSHVTAEGESAIILTPEGYEYVYTRVRMA